MVFWIRRNVPEPEEWHAAKSKARHHEPGLADLFRGGVRSGPAVAATARAGAARAPTRVAAQTVVAGAPAS